jgi:hypothetical protein
VWCTGPHHTLEIMTRARRDGAGQRTTSDAQLAMPSNAFNAIARSPVSLCSCPDLRPPQPQEFHHSPLALAYRQSR